MQLNHSYDGIFVSVATGGGVQVGVMVGDAMVGRGVLVAVTGGRVAVYVAVQVGLGELVGQFTEVARCVGVFVGG